MCVDAHSHLSALVVVYGGLDHPGLDGRRLWVLVLRKGWWLGDGGAVIVVVPHRPGVWAFVGLEVAIDASTWHARKPWVPHQQFCGGAIRRAPRPSWSWSWH